MYVSRESAAQTHERLTRVIAAAEFRVFDVLGTDALVVCGSNAARGGIFDYWGVPLVLADAAIAEVRRLRAVA